MRAPRSEKARRAQEARARTREARLTLDEYYELRKKPGTFEYVTLPPGPIALDEDAVHIRYENQVHSIYGLSLLDDATKEGSHTDLECTCGWSSIACFPKIHAMMNKDEHKCLVALGARTKESSNLKARRALEKQDVRAMVDAYYELRLWDRTFRYEDYIKRDHLNRVYVNHTRRIKYKNTLHAVSRVSDDELGEAAKTATHMGLKCDCYDAWHGRLCYPKIHVMMKEDEDRCLQALGLQSKQEQNLKKPERRRPEHDVNAARVAELIETLRLFQEELNRAGVLALMIEDPREFVRRLSPKVVEWRAHLSGLVKYHTPHAVKRHRAPPCAREHTTTSSVNSASVSPSAHRVDSASGDDASSHSTGRLENAVDWRTVIPHCRPWARPKAPCESREALQAFAKNIM